MGTNSKFLWYDWWEEGGTISASSAAAGFPASNTQDQALSKTWRSTSATGEEWILRDLGQSREIGGISVVSHNEDENGKLRVRISANPDLSSPVYDSGFVFGLSALYGASEEPDGASSEIVGAGGVPLAVVRPLLPGVVSFFVPTTAVSGRYVEVRARNTVNPDGYIEIALVQAGVTREVSVNVGGRFQLGRPDSIYQAVAGSGEKRIASQFKRVETEAEFTFQSDQEAREFWVLALRHLGSSRMLTAILVEGNNPAWSFYTTIACRFKDIAPIEHRGHDNHVVPVRLLEMVSG